MDDGWGEKDGGMKLGGDGMFSLKKYLKNLLLIYNTFN